MMSSGAGFAGAAGTLSQKPMPLACCVVPLTGASPPLPCEEPPSGGLALPLDVLEELALELEELELAELVVDELELAELVLAVLVLDDLVLEELDELVLEELAPPLPPNPVAAPPPSSPPS